MINRRGSNYGDQCHQLRTAATHYFFLEIKAAFPGNAR